jgi:hypothetical protein
MDSSDDKGGMAGGSVGLAALPMNGKAVYSASGEMALVVYSTMSFDDTEAFGGAAGDLVEIQTRDLISGAYQALGVRLGAAALIELGELAVKVGTLMLARREKAAQIEGVRSAGLLGKPSDAGGGAGEVD